MTLWQASSYYNAALLFINEGQPFLLPQEDVLQGGGGAGSSSHHQKGLGSRLSLHIKLWCAYMENAEAHTTCISFRLHVGLCSGKHPENSSLLVFYTVLDCLKKGKPCCLYFCWFGFHLVFF